MKVQSFDELDANQVKELIQTSKKPIKKSKKLPLDKKRMHPHGRAKHSLQARKFWKWILPVSCFRLSSLSLN